MMVARNVLLSPAEVGFETSGHSGAPTRWWRSAAQIDAETRLVADLLVGEVDHIVTFAPPSHLFGFLFGRVLAHKRRLSVYDAWRDPSAAPDLPPRARTLIVCVPSAWAVLRHVIGPLADLPLVVALHGTAPITPTTHQVAAALEGPRFSAFELLGSTETGAIAHRAIGPEPTDCRRFTAFPDVTLLPDGGGRPGSAREQRLVVAGPRLGRRDDMRRPPTRWCLNDLVRLCGDRSFEYLGRRTRLIKINGRRCDLAQVEAAVQAREPGLDVACLAVRDPIRGEHYELYFSGPAVPDAAPADTAAARILSSIAAWPDVPVPRAVHRLPRIPRTATGKVRLAELRAPSGSGLLSHG